MGAPSAPNPARDRTTVAVAVEKPSLVRVEVFDAPGRVVHRQRLPLAEGTAEIGLDLAALPAGYYLVRVTDGERTATQPLTVVR